MLILTRKSDEGFVIGNGEIRVLVIDVIGEKVRLGIEAPSYVKVHRDEVYLAIKKRGEMVEPCLVAPSIA
jgi:carbon storage regulator